MNPNLDESESDPLAILAVVQPFSGSAYPRLKLFTEPFFFPVMLLKHHGPVMPRHTTGKFWLTLNGVL